MEPLTNEAALVAACQRGELHQFDPLYRHYVQPIFAFIQRRTLDRQVTEDLTSTVFLRALEKIGMYRSAKGPFAAWLYGIARNAITDHFRSRKDTVDIEDVWDLSSSDDVHMETSDRIAFGKIKDALQTLDRAKREIVLLRIWDGLSYKEIAALTGKTETNCKVIFSRAIDALRKEVPLAVLFLLLTFPFRP